MGLCYQGGKGVARRCFVYPIVGTQLSALLILQKSVINNHVKLNINVIRLNKLWWFWYRKMMEILNATNDLIFWKKIVCVAIYGSSLKGTSIYWKKTLHQTARHK